MENLPPTGHEESATSLNRGENNDEISRAINRLRFDMRRPRPLNTVHRQLEEIQTHYDKAVESLNKLYKYANEARTAILKEWESDLREDLLSIEHDVRDYSQGKQTSAEEQTDTGGFWRSVAELRVTDQLSSLTNDDLPLPPEDAEFNRLLLKISNNILECDIKKINLFFQGPGIIGKRDLEDISHPTDFFLQLRKSGHLTPNNIVVLQAVLWNTGNIELFNEVTQFAEKMRDTVYVSVPSSTPASGYKYVKLHYKKKPSRETLDGLRQMSATWFGTPLLFVSVVGQEPSN